MKDLYDKIENLKTLDKSKYPVGEIKEIFKGLGKAGYVEVKLHPGKEVMRARMNNLDEVFFSKCQLSYTPPQFNNLYQRASTPGMTMFYGSIIPELDIPGELNYVRLIGVLEAIPWLRKQGINGIQNLTFGRWILSEELRLMAIVFERDYFDKSLYTKEIVDSFEKYMLAHPKLVKRTITINDFLAAEFSKDEILNDYDYLLSALYTEMVVSSGFDGVLYPSVRTGGMGFNLAITPYAADNKLDLRAVGECIVYKKGMNWFVDNLRSTELYPSQTHFEMVQLEYPSHVGEKESLRRIDAKSIDELRSSNEE